MTTTVRPTPPSAALAPALAPTRAALQHELAVVRARGGRVAFVPTMGALHEGHASLVRVARDHVGADGAVVVSIFVNPLQFGEGEDLDRYPRTLDADLALCAAEGVDVVFAPAVDEVYPGGDPQVTVEPGPLATVLEGASRPGHFRGVLTVVAKLFGLVQPDVAVFGQKDYQQLALVRRMAADLCLPVEVVGAETVREADGLALSSRNRYLDAEQRRLAVVLSRALSAAADHASYGVDAARQAAATVLAEAPQVEVDYLVVTEADLAEVDPARTDPREGRVLVAARLGATRLIDNLPLDLRATGAPGFPA
ncbi:pantoate--beta-alanine ligase [Nocardioides sp. ChNu-153]|uniref:pantoate--beta-alanine ligase n=1 Tax=unclassified Nocardioides TaxID=2615069 RepID=UPI0024068403|nr:MULTISPECIES: pantoate--beta-alanine ligase [unclassified Nocardioides]MDF9716270.1 pantoate--beta-alanine ligase [Nocardioides sp. ChNu-99]MDN7121988.1 pantoate--beta-alanine ligase [Nocardioides sp. ChNu-153]